MRIGRLAMILLLALTIHHSPAQPPEQFSDSIRVLTWNIFLVSPIAPRQAIRSEAIAKILAKGEFDVIVLQEVFKRRHINRMKLILDSVYPHQLLPKKRRAIYSSGVWVLSKHPIIDSDAILFRERRHFDRFADKGAVQVRVQKESFLLDIIATHTQAMSRPKHFDTRESQFRQIRRCLFQDDDVPDLIIGDLNTPKYPKNRYANMLDILDAEDGHVLVPKNLNVSDTVCYTWGCVFNDLTPEGQKGKTGLYDYALIRNNGRHVQLDRTLRIDEGENERGKFNLSDHYAIDVLIKY